MNTENREWVFLEIKVGNIMEGLCQAGTKLRCSTAALPALWDSQTRRQQSSNGAFFTKALCSSPGFTASHKHLKSLSSLRHCTQDPCSFSINRNKPCGLCRPPSEAKTVVTWDCPQ